MATILYYTNHHTDDPTRLGLPFIGTNGAREAGHKAVVALAAGIYPMREG